ncbi:MAG: rcsC [Cytophagaceae bacterium]|nr:rcsC [Cytophagaceae bacterium]
METLSKSENYYFLRGGGEMGALMRGYDWSSTSLGTPDQWPGSLRHTVSILLNAALPMALFWGKESIFFYNDAFIPSLGLEGPHPILGKKTDAWSDRNDLLLGLVEQVSATQQAIRQENQLVSFYRNGKLEDTYWTFSYSPVYEENGTVGGVLSMGTETTPEIKSRERLKKNEAQLRAILDSAPAAIALFVGRDLVIEMPNQSFIDIAGKGQDIIGKKLAEAVPELQGQPFLKILDDVFTSGKPLQLESSPIQILQDGVLNQYYYDFTYTPVLDANGEVYAILDIAIDVTKQVMDRQKLEQSEQRIRSLVESVPFPIGVYTGKEMKIEFANKNILDVWGKGYDVIGKLYREILPELDNQQIFNQLEQVYATAIPFHAKNEQVDLMHEGKIKPFWFNYSFTPLFDQNNKVYGVMNTAADVTDLNLATQKIKQSEWNFRNMVLQAPVAMCIMLGPDHVVEVANELMIELWGKPVEDVMNKPIFEGLPDAKEQGLEKLLADVYSTGLPFHANEMPVSLLRKGKLESVYQNFVYEPYKDVDGKILGVLAISIDVTQQVLARQKIEEVVSERTKELASSNHNLQRSNAELEQFAYIASHDLQEPLRKISMFSQMLEQSTGELSDKSKRYLSKINDSTHRMINLVRDVLAYSQLSKENRTFEAVDLNKIVADIKTDFELLIEQKDATIQSDVLPVLQAIPLQMAQLFGNLISNALKFKREGVAPVISIQVEKMTDKEVKKLPQLDFNKSFYHIIFSDNGIGFNDEYAEQIFNIFQRLHGKTQFAGTGIGLAICKKVVQNHQGDIYATGKEGQGAVFHIVLPE